MSTVPPEDDVRTELATAGDGRTPSPSSRTRSSPRSILAGAAGAGVGLALGWATQAPVLPASEPIPPVVGVDPQSIDVELTQMSHSELFRVGDLALRRGQLELARAALARATRLNPAFADAHQRLGDALVASGELNAAAESYKVLVALRPAALTDGMSAFLTETARERR